MSAPAPVPESSVSRVVLASFLGTMIEWYDFFLYGTASALVFNKLFFTDLDPRTGTIAAFATNAVGFFARPLGGVVFGHYGDRIGRKSMLVTTLVIMGVATCLIGLLPTYNTIGIAAPVLLVLLRFAQGFGVGGEWGGAVLMAVEHGHQGRRGLYASWVQAGVAAGMILASGVFGLFSLLPEDQFLAWGWRVPFLLGVVLLGIGLFIRVRVMETPLFAAHLVAEKPQTLPILEVLRDYPRNVLLAMGARCGENASFYIITVFVLTLRPERALQSSLGQSDPRERRPRLPSSSLLSPERAKQRLFRPFRAWAFAAIHTQGGATRLSPLRSALGWLVMPLRGGRESGGTQRHSCW
jgi:MHS family shikimate/dehydroshikimate transporter-like MFS transporter